MDSTGAIVFATFLGPIFAVIMTMVVDRLRQTRSRRMDVFRSLLGNRRAILSQDRVKALNLVEVEFYGKKRVIAAHRELMQHINTRADADNPTPWGDRQRTLLAKLLSEMATVLKYRKFEQLDLREGGYLPQGYVDIEADQTAVRRMLVELLSGARSLPVHSAPPTPPPSFPPVPPRPGHLDGR